MLYLCIVSAPEIVSIQLAKPLNDQRGLIVVILIVINEDHFQKEIILNIKTFITCILIAPVVVTLSFLLNHNVRRHKRAI